MTKRIIAAIALALMVNAVPLAAEAGGFWTGNKLLSCCESTGSFYVDCRGYVTGVAETLAAGASVGGLGVCFPKSDSSQNVTEIVVTYLRRNPDDCHNAAAGLVAEALAEAFPCR